MGYGLFGKLPQKRDFVSVGMPHAILNPFETWLQSAIAASRSEIGRNWEQYYLVAPIWRFWLGRDLFGTACTGSLMPSVDQVGRYFPLAIIYYAEPGETLVPPLLNLNDGWYRRIEERLLSVLSESATGDIAALLGGLLAPDYRAAPPPPAAAEDFSSPPPVPDGFMPGSLTQSEDEPVDIAHTSDIPVKVEDHPAPASLPDADEGADTPDLWDPVPMPAESLAALQQTSGSGLPLVPPHQHADDPGLAPAEPAAPPIVAAAAPAPPASVWDFSPADLPELSPAARVETTPAAELQEPAAPPPLAATTTAAAPPLAVLGTPSASPSPPVPEARPSRVEVGEFKGGFLGMLPPDVPMQSELPELLRLDYAAAAQGRGFWWCGPSSSGGPHFYSRPALPDPYFFSRMLMWRT